MIKSDTEPTDFLKSRGSVTGNTYHHSAGPGGRDQVGRTSRDPPVLTLENADLLVMILDPAVDAENLGSRYCSGGYVWQVMDAEHGDVLSGPCFPDPKPPVFDGQGLPEVFEIALGQDRAKVGNDVWVIGVGRVRRESSVVPFHVRDNPTVVERSHWKVDAAETSVTMRSHEAFDEFELELERRVSIDGRALTSQTSLHNRGSREIPVRWFAHPFFPWPGAECFRPSLEMSLPENPGFFVNASGFVERRLDHDWTKGCYVVPRVALGGELAVEQKHPGLGSVEVSCRFPLAWLAVWGNDRTVSFEPYHQTLLAPGNRSVWGIEYRL
jgi:hypothetical protein